MLREEQRLLDSVVDDDLAYDVEDQLEEDAPDDDLEDDTEGDISDEEYGEAPDDFDDSPYRDEAANEDDYRY